MKYELQKLTVPDNYKVVQNVFFTYDPETDYSENENLLYLSEDLLQLKNEKLNLIIDLGWYGEIYSNKGTFKLYVIENQDWENPVITEASKSQKIITEKLEKLLLNLESRY
ncbi:hypothetical protein [Flavobacterium pedocola]